MEDLIINDRVTIPEAELGISFARASGAGGQNVNKVETKVELRWNPGHSAVLSDADRAWLLQRIATRLTGAGDLVVTSDKTRNQGRNREDARDKLAVIVREGLTRPKRRRKTRTPRGAVERRIKKKKQRSQTKRSRKPPARDD